MKWPWVSRAAYEELQSELQAERVERDRSGRFADLTLRQKDWIAQQFELLTDKYHDLRKQGFTASPVAQPVPPATPDQLIGRAIDSVPASRDPKNRARMWAQVNADRVAHISDEEIIMRIQRGTRPAEQIA